MLNFTDGQKKVVTAGLTVLAFTVMFAFVVVVLKAVVSLIAVFVVVKHKSNIRRLIDGCENKIY